MVSEFEFIHNLKSKYALDRIGDDCAVLPKDDTTDLLLTADLLAEDVDFRLDWSEPELLGQKALAVSLSDIAAMGGTPKWSMLSIGVSEKLWKTDFLERFYDGWHKLAALHEVELVGGDVSKTSDKLVIDSVVGGEVKKGEAILRSGANAGEAIFVTGFLGGAAAGLKLLESGVRLDSSLSAPTKHLLLRQLQPIPQTRTGATIQDNGLATSMIDISDGLSSDLSHILHSSNVGARIWAKDIPVEPAINDLSDFDLDTLDLALNGGEDFELLFTVDKKNISACQDLGFHMIGEIASDEGIIELIGENKMEILQPKGYRHF